MIRRLVIASALASVAAFTLVAPSGASAATTIGETFVPTATFASDYTGLEAQSPGNQYSAPSRGVITSWSFQASASAPPQGLKLKVARPMGGTDFTIVGESGPKNPTTSQLNTYTDVSIPVEAGDVIGLYMGSQTVKTYRNVLSGSGFGEVEDAVDFAPNTPSHTYGGPYNIQLDVSAKLEPDCDADSLGDETQDPSVFGPNCPQHASSPKKKKCKKHKKKHKSGAVVAKKCKKKHHH